ncbi:MAG: hypothetical protein LQ340_006584, partial [Diploschistes diacapsis]
MFKPFKAPSFLKKGAPRALSRSLEEGRAPKRQRLGDEVETPRKPLHAIRSSSSSLNTELSPPDREHDQTDTVFYKVLWRKFTTKKNKTWDGDGILRVTKGYAYLEDASGRELGKNPCTGPLLPESKLSVGGREVEVDCLLSKKEYLSRQASRVDTKPKNVPITSIKVPLSKPKPKPELVPAEEQAKAEKPLNPAAPKSAATSSRFKNPVLETTVLEKRSGPAPTPRHDPHAAGALVMRRVKNVPRGRQPVDVVVDPLLSKHLREHQRDGVRFLYDCVMDIKDFGGQGAILADEMGLGKTLQTIALLWTLLKQNPIHGDTPVVKKALIVCPATLINNWKKEFRKWLGAERIGVLVVDDNKKRITDFTLGRTYSVIVISYEKLRTNIEELQKGPGVDIVIADEGHRLKKEQNKSGVAIRSLSTPRKIILSGTPIQNDLSEFYSMINFVNPGILGSVKTFTKQFEVPIVKSRQPEASENDIENGQARSEELAETTSPFILRRTADILSKYLPTKTEYILLCRPTKAQAAVYQRVLKSSSFRAALGGASELHLQLITLLKKICNSPRLLLPADSATFPNALKDPSDLENPSLTTSLISELPSHLLRNNGASAKLRVLDSLLHHLSHSTDEKIVLVSHSTSTLDLLSSLLTAHSLPHLRLDGSTPLKQRQDLVDSFNRSAASHTFAFLLSAKAGGQGINLIGASRLVLFDVDWNPAIDAQAMARIHRDGQRRPCVVYRLLLAGAMDEKIWQRQVTKVGLADAVMEHAGKGKGRAGKAAFTREELRDLFRLDVREGKEGRGGCQTHELIGCSCGGRGMPMEAAEMQPEPGADGQGGRQQDDDDEDNNEDDGLPPPAILLRKANEVDMEAQERQIRVQHAAKKKAANKRREG